jgi:hypothetical protein
VPRLLRQPIASYTENAANQRSWGGYGDRREQPVSETGHQDDVTSTQSGEGSIDHGFG